MPVTSSTSSIKRWPSAEVVLAAASAWARTTAARQPDLIALACFGSYARGEAGFGSDLDLLAVVKTDAHSTARRVTDWNTESLPVPVDLLIYTFGEWKRLEEEGGRFVKTLRAEARWLVGQEVMCPGPVPASARASETKENDMPGRVPGSICGW